MFYKDHCILDSLNNVVWFFTDPRKNLLQVNFLRLTLNAFM